MSHHVLFEVGLEELPARFIDDSENQLMSKTRNWLKELRISYESIISYSTPRRLAILINGIAAEQTALTKEVRGPSEKIAKDREGNWTKAAIGFTKGQGKMTDDIYIKNIKDSTYIFVKKHIEGKSTVELLPSFKNNIESIHFKKSMRWAEKSFKYARPIRWLVALYDDQTIPFEIADVKTKNITYGHRFLGKKIHLNTPLEYQDKLRKNYVIADPKEREQRILSEMKELEKKEKFKIEIDQHLLNEVRNLVEFPTVFSGSYEKDFLNLPPEVLITSMQEHQRYFPVKSSEDRLLPNFIGVRNGDNYEMDTVIRGNEKVLHARLSDAQFFYAEDKKHSIDFYQQKLTRVIFQDKLGTLFDKVKRVKEGTKQLADALNIDDVTTTQAMQTAKMSKFALMTDMVNEFTELQGVMGEKYALYFGEDQNVAKAIREHYLPNQAKGKLPETLPGALVSIVDKLDTIVGFISAGLTPTGSQDPYSLRRQAVGILRIIEERQWDITLESMIEIAQNQYKQSDHEIKATLTKELHDFFKLRAGYLLREKDIEQDVVQAVLQKETGVFSYTIAKANVLSKKRNDPNFKHTQEALVRILKLGKTETQINVNPALFETSSEQLLHEKFEKIYLEFKKVTEQQKAEQALLYLAELTHPIYSFFENNMVMAEDEQIRKNRLCLVNNLAFLIEDFADLAAVQWKQHT